MRPLAACFVLAISLACGGSLDSGPDTGAVAMEEALGDWTTDRLGADLEAAGWSPEYCHQEIGVFRGRVTCYADRGGQQALFAVTASAPGEGDPHHHAIREVDGLDHIVVVYDMAAGEAVLDVVLRDDERIADLDPSTLAERLEAAGWRVGSWDVKDTDNQYAAEATIERGPVHGELTVYRYPDQVAADTRRARDLATVMAAQGDARIEVSLEDPSSATAVLEEPW